MKLKNIIKYRSLLLTGAAVLVLASCSLDEIPRDKQIAGAYGSPRELEQATIGAYTRLRDLSNNLYLHLSEVRSDNMWVNPSPNGYREYSELGTFRADYTDAYIKGAWETLYQVIFAVNSVLDSFEEIDFPNDNDNVSFKNQLRGELHFLRGWCYFELVRLYGYVPLIDKVISPAEAKSTGQSTPTEIYDFVIEELKIAEENLPMPGDMINYKYEGDNNGRPDRIAAKAMLGRAYMTRAGFPMNDSPSLALAKTKIKEVLDYSVANGNKYWAPTIDDWRRQFTPAGNNEYSIFAIQYRSGGYGNKAIFNYSKALPPTYTGIRIMGNDIYSEKSLQYEFTRDYTGGKDLRGFDWSVINGYDEEDSWPEYPNTLEELDYGAGPYDVYTLSIITKFLTTKQKVAYLNIANPETGMNDYDDWGVNYSVIRLEDMQLMYAEIIAAEGDVAGAMQYVNDIRQRAGIDPLTASNGAEALQHVKNERRLELAFEGVRWFDIVRWGEWQDLIIAKFNRYRDDTGALPSGVSTSNVADGRHYYPIPMTELDNYPGLYTQNEGY